MSCQIKLIASIADVPTIRRCLFPTDDLRGSDSWLQLCQVSASPTGETVIIANEKRLVVLTANWNPITSLTQFEISFSGSVDGEDPITAVLCLPVVIQSQSSQVGPEWICLAIGFESGFVRFYTEDCKLLLSEQFHNQSVSNIKCHSQHSPRPDINFELRQEEIYIQYPSNVCNISGTQLFTILRNCHNQLAQGLGKGDPETTIAGTCLKKWGFSDQFAINDVAIVGLDLANTFDHLLTASTCGGFESRYRAMPPHNNLVMAAGSKPFVAFNYATEGGPQPVLTDVAKAVASKLKSALPGWLTGNKASLEKQMTLALQPAEPMGCRFGVCDLRRTAISIILSQDRRLAAVTDVLGRVMLMDTHRGVVLRMFKGYRDAQCAFLQVPDEKRSKHRANTRVATFLVVYSPKKGTLEIFSVQQGLKIATFTASKFSILLYINYGLVGFTVTSKSKYVCSFTCIMMDSDGQVKEVVVPFHFALAEKNSKRARDLHLYKRLKQFIKTGDHSLENFLAEVLNTCMEIKTCEVHLQCLQMLASCKEVEPEIILKCTEYFSERYPVSDDEDVTGDMKTLQIFSEHLSILTRFYLFLTSISDEELDIKNGNDSDANKDKKDTKLHLGDTVLYNLQKLLDLSTLSDNNKSHEPKVSFFEDDGFHFWEYIYVFDLSKPEKVNLKPKLDSTTLFKISELIFKQYILENRSDFEELEQEILKSRFLISDLLKMVLFYWVNRALTMDFNLQQELQNLNQVIYTLSKTEPIHHMTVEYNQISPFWTEIREVLADSAKPFPALTAAFICRNVAQTIEVEKELQLSGASIEDESMEIWEKMSHENCEWALIIGKLEDVSLLNIILSNRPCFTDTKHCTLPKLKYEHVDISLKYVLEKGKGTVSELVAQWLTTAGVDPESIVLNELENPNIEQASCSIVGEGDGKRKSKPKLEPLFEHLNAIKKQFPYSLDPSVLLANMCWEYALTWQKYLQEFSYLEAAIKCLNYIPQTHVKQGLYNLVWNTHLKIIFESACKLINKVGKLPKERLCKQDTGLTDFQIAHFISLCTTFLDDFLEVVQQSYNCEKTWIRYEGIWDNGGQSLAELALQQNHINYEFLHAHYQLSLTIEMITKLTVKHTKPVNNLFDSTVISLFFTDMQQKTQVGWQRPDAKINASRTQFLLKVISASIETVTVNENKIYSTDHVNWMAKCLSLARLWNLDVDLLKRFQVIQLFASGFDSIAEELLPTLTELDKLGPDLLAVAGKRLHQVVSSASELGEKITALSPSLTQYLDSLLQNGEWCAPSSLEAIMTIGTHCLRCLEENQTEYKIACQLLEACSTLQDIER